MVNASVVVRGCAAALVIASAVVTASVAVRDMDCALRTAVTDSAVTNASVVVCVKDRAPRVPVTDSDMVGASVADRPSIRVMIAASLVVNASVAVRTTAGLTTAVTTSVVDCWTYTPKFMSP